VKRIVASKPGIDRKEIPPWRKDNVMNAFEHASRIWPVLALAARNRQILTYEMVGQLIGVPARGLGRMLEPIQSYCLIRELPALTILVVSKDSGMPGEGFIAAENIPAEQARVFGHDWLTISPTREELEGAALTRPSNGERMPLLNP
jgi:hypothetical protein